jgi:serine O-acetyltransferase
VGAGAKVLGPITLGVGAKVGANSVVIKDVPGHKTIVGIPGKVVQTGDIGSLNPFGVDLNHHLIPDPVADAIACLVDRITTLEKNLAGSREQQDCEDCNASEICEPDESGADTHYTRSA